MCWPIVVMMQTTIVKLSSGRAIDERNGGSYVQRVRAHEDLRKKSTNVLGIANDGKHIENCELSL